MRSGLRCYKKKWCKVLHKAERKSSALIGDRGVGLGIGKTRSGYLCPDETRNQGFDEIAYLCPIITSFTVGLF